MSELLKESVSAIRGYIPGEQPRIPGLVKLNTNENPYPPSPAVEKALKECDFSVLRRYPDPACYGVRSRLADIHKCSADRVFVGNGSDEILALCTRAFVEDNGAISYFDPSYSLYPVLTAIRDVDAEPVPLGDNFRWRPPLAEKASLFFLTNPNAPTGVFYPRGEIGRFCEEFNGVVVIDEAYVDFADADCMDFALAYDNVLCVRTLSKSFSLAAIRVGYAVGNEELIGALGKIKDSYNVNTLSQVAAKAALNDLAHMRGNVERIKKDRERLHGELSALGFAVVPSQANFLWAKHPGMESTELYKQLRERAILVRHFDGPLTRDYLRITIGTSAEMDRLVETLEAILAE